MFSTKTPTSTAQQAPVALSSLRIQTSLYGLVIPMVYGSTRLPLNVLSYNDFTSIAHTTNTPTPSSGGAKGGAPAAPAQTSVNFTYTAALQFAVCAGQIAGIGRVWKDKAETTTAALGLAVALGSYPQSPWDYLTTTHPEQADNYPGLAHLDGATFDLGTDASLPNHTVEVFGRCQALDAGSPDAHMRAVIADFLTNPHDGAHFPAQYLDANDQYHAYCTANGFFLSPVVDQQQEARQYLSDWAVITNSEWVWSSAGKLKIVPYGDTAVSGFGATYTPNLAPEFDLSDDDFLEPPSFVRSSPADATNKVTLEILDRNNQYNTVPVEYKDQPTIEQYGLRYQGSIAAHPITVPATGQAIVNAIGQRGLYVRNTPVKFKLGWRFCRLEGMDLVTLTDPALGFDRQLVRIKTIDEDEAGALTFTAEQVDVGVAQHALHDASKAGGSIINTNAPPPSMNVPVIFGAPIALASGLELWLAACAPRGAGGCDVWVSRDDATYAIAGLAGGRKYGNSRMGVLTGTMPASTSDPDRTSTCPIDVTESRSVLLSGTQADADSESTMLCYVADADGRGEFFSYQTATLTGVYTYTLGTYMRRGLFGTEPRAHVAGTPFVRIDAGIFRVPYPVDEIGKPIFVKLTAFNDYGAAEQSLADVAESEIICPAPPLPPDIEDFSATQAGETVAFSWRRVDDGLLVGYDIRYGPAGVIDWNAMLPLTEAARGAYEVNASVPSGAWTFAIRARDIANQFSLNPAYVTRVIIDQYPTVDETEQDPLWPGIKNNCVQHYSGVLIPDGTALANTDTAQDVFDQFVWQPVATFSYEAPASSLAKTAQLAVAAGMSARLGPGETAGKPNPLLFERHADSNIDPLMWNADPNTLMWNADPNTLMWSGVTDYALWTKGVLRTAYIQLKVQVSTADGVAMLQTFKLDIDQPHLVDGANGFNVPPGGARINFGNPDFLFAPFVVPNAQAAGLFATSSAVDADGFTCHVFNVNAGGTDVGGLVDWNCHN